MSDLGRARERGAALHGSALLVVFVAVAAALFVLAPATPQRPDYHEFADARALGPIPNAWNVLTNLPFVVTGALGLHLLLSRGARAEPPLAAWERLGFAALYGGVALVAAGSAYYHWAPSNATLLWDRLPMSIAFMALAALVVGDRVTPRAGRALLAPLLVLGPASVLYWHFTEVAGQGDLRPYALVQGFPLLAILVLLSTALGRSPGGVWLSTSAIAYGLAKAAEHLDRAILESSGGLVGGHALKHLLAGLGTLLLVRWLGARVR